MTEVAMSLSHDWLDVGLGTCSCDWSCGGSHDRSDPVWLYDLPTVMCLWGSGVTVYDTALERTCHNFFDIANTMPHIIYCWDTLIKVYTHTTYMGLLYTQFVVCIQYLCKCSFSIPFKEYAITLHIIHLMPHIICCWKALITASFIIIQNHFTFSSQPEFKILSSI